MRNAGPSDGVIGFIRYTATLTGQERGCDRTALIQQCGTRRQRNPLTRRLHMRPEPRTLMLTNRLQLADAEAYGANLLIKQVPGEIVSAGQRWPRRWPQNGAQGNRPPRHQNRLILSGHTGRHADPHPPWRYLRLHTGNRHIGKGQADALVLIFYMGNIAGHRDGPGFL